MSSNAAPNSSSRPIAIIGGTGPAGMALALRWARAGEKIIIGSRDEKRAQQAAEATKQKAGAQANVTGMENAAACGAADILMLTVPFEGQAALLKQLKPAIPEGSILIDATVPLASVSRRTRLPPARRLARIGRRTDSGTGAKGRERRCCISQSFRRNSQRRRSTRLRRDRVQ